MKKKLVLLLILVTTIIFAQTSIGASAVTKDTVQSTIETNATGQIEVSPDIAYVNANISIINENKDLTYSTNKTSTASLVNALIAAGIAKTDIKTTSFYASTFIDKVVVDPQAANPVYKDVKKYQTTTNLKITIKDISVVGDILDKMLGVENVDITNVSYDVSNSSKYKQAAIKKAVDLAKENITFAAGAANVKLDKLQTLTVDFNNNSNPVYTIYSKVMQNTEASAPMYQNPENIKISASVHMVYFTK